ncbi:MAG TPA: HIT family protein [bacterium]|jgi:diadenosine tetraphosphate (Ap4A) HIT family hydrolase|nr:HIT family protein [bacterium]
MSVEASCPACLRVQTALQGREPWLVAVLPHSVLLLGDHQAYPGYSVLFSRAHVKELHDLDEAAFTGFTQDLRRASRAVESATGCWKLNLASLGNVLPHLHVHLFPRAAAEERRFEHPWANADRFHNAGSAVERQAWILRLRSALEAAP